MRMRYAFQMADQYLLVTAGSGTPRVALISKDDATFQLRTFNAADAAINSVTLSTEIITALCNLWNKTEDRVYVISNSLRVAITAGEKFMFTNTTTAADASVKSDEIELTTGQSGALVAFIQSGFTNI